MLRGFFLVFLDGGLPGIQGRHQELHFPMPAQLAKAPFGIAQRSGDPAQRHRPVLPSLDVAREVGDRAVQVLDRVGGAQRAVQRTGDAQRHQDDTVTEVDAVASSPPAGRAL